MSVRIIARLDIKGSNLVKGIHLEGLRVLGKPERFARKYYTDGADELLYMDVVASLYERNSLHDVIARTAEEIFIPLTVGGGIRSIEDITSVLRSGADKVSLNTAAVKNPAIIKEAAESFGSSTVVVAIEAVRQEDGTYLNYTDNGRDFTGVEVREWAQCVEDLGAGEIVLTSVDREGTGQGFDIELTRLVSDAVAIPVIAHGGAGNPGHILEAIEEGRADAVAIASVVHYDFIKKSGPGHKDVADGNTEFLKSGKTFSMVQPTGFGEIGDYLADNGISGRGRIATE